MVPVHKNMILFPRASFWVGFLEIKTFLAKCGWLWRNRRKIKCIEIYSVFSLIPHVCRVFRSQQQYFLHSFWAKLNPQLFNLSYGGVFTSDRMIEIEVLKQMSGKILVKNLKFSSENRAMNNFAFALPKKWQNSKDIQRCFHSTRRIHYPLNQSKDRRRSEAIGFRPFKTRFDCFKVWVFRQ